MILTVLVITNSKSPSPMMLGAQGWSWSLLSQGPASVHVLLTNQEPQVAQWAPRATPTPAQVLTLLQLVPDHPQEGHRYHEQVDDEASLAQLSDGGATQPSDHTLVGVLVADGGGIAQDDQPTDQEDEGDLQSRTVGQGAPRTQASRPLDSDMVPSIGPLTCRRHGCRPSGGPSPALKPELQSRWIVQASLSVPP